MIRQSAAVTFRPELSNYEYHLDCDFDSHSALQQFRKSPLRYYHQRITKRIPPKKQSPEMRLGSVLHTAILEPAEFDRLLLVIPEEVLSKSGAKSGKSWESFEWEHRDKILLKQAEYDDIRWQVDSVNEHPTARKILDDCTSFEQSVFVDDGKHKRKCRFDAVAEVSAAYHDLKRTSCESEDEFWRNVQKFGFHRQAAHYSDLFEAAYGSRPLARWIIVLDEAPFETYVRRVPKAAIELGRIENAETLRAIAKARETGNWHREGAHDDRDLYLPEYFYRGA